MARHEPLMRDNQCVLAELWPQLLLDEEQYGEGVHVQVVEEALKSPAHSLPCETESILNMAPVISAEHEARRLTGSPVNPHHILGEKFR